MSDTVVPTELEAMDRRRRKELTLQVRRLPELHFEKEHAQTVGVEAIYQTRKMEPKGLRALPGHYVGWRMDLRGPGEKQRNYP